MQKVIPNNMPSQAKLQLITNQVNKPKLEDLQITSHIEIMGIFQFLHNTYFGTYCNTTHYLGTSVLKKFEVACVAIVSKHTNLMQVPAIVTGQIMHRSQSVPRYTYHLKSCRKTTIPETNVESCNWLQHNENEFLLTALNTIYLEGLNANVFH